MKAGRLILLGAGLLTLDVFFHELAPMNHWRPPLLLFFSIWLGTRTPTLAGLTIILALTVLEDGLSSTPLGTGMSRLGTLYLLTAVVSQKLSVRRTFGAIVLGASMSVLDLVLLATLARLGFPDLALNEKLSALMLPRLIIGAVCLPIVFWVLDRMMGRPTRAGPATGLRFDLNDTR